MVGTLYVYDAGSINSAFFSLDGTAHQLNLNLLDAGTVGGLVLDGPLAASRLRLGDVDDPDQWYGYGKGLDFIAYRTGHDRNTTIDGLFNTYIKLTLDADMPTPPYVSNFELSINGSHDLTYGAIAQSTVVDINDAATVSSSDGIIKARSDTVNWNGPGTNAGALTGYVGASQTYDGVNRNVSGVTGWVGIYGGTVNGIAAAFYAQAPSLGGTITGHNVGYFNENWGEHGFSWYSEGGTLHAETGHANNVGIEVIAAASQVADLQRWLASDETTVLAKVDKDGKITAADVLITGGSSIKPLAGVTGSIGGGLLSAGACASGTASITGARSTMGVVSTPTSYPGDGADWEAYVSADDVVTVKVCGLVAVTPTATTYQVRVTP